MKRNFAILLTLLMCLSLCVPTFATDENQQEEMVETTYVTEDGVVVRVFAHKSVDIEEEDGALIIEGKEYLVEDNLPVTQGANVPTLGYNLSDGADTQSGSISAGGRTYSNKLYYPSNKNEFQISYSGTAESKGGKRGEIYLFGVGLYDSQHKNKQIDFHEATSISLTGKISWKFADTFPYTLTEFCYLQYIGNDANATSYNITVS